MYVCMCMFGFDALIRWFGHARRSQGGCVSHIKPEHLLEPRDYRQWVKKQTGASNGSEQCHSVAAVDDVVFESLSKRAWMDVLLQLIKVSLRFHSFFVCFIVYL